MKSVCLFLMGFFCSTLFIGLPLAQHVRFEPLVDPWPPAFMRAR